MDHVAIMNKKLGLIDKILLGNKTIESRWLKNKSAPYGKIKAGDIVYFKNSGDLVIAKATVKKVIQYDNIDQITVKKIISKYGGVGGICIQNQDFLLWTESKKYCVLIWLENPQSITSFKIDKTGFGIGSAWITVKNIAKIRLHPAVADRLGDGL